ncbi:integrase [Halogeometricum borinquense DSM 11551]|uniref:Integrase n=1 Tax=Halogeometricum borinquense (strain ATCC 700274 / DSM 11551 / JCM 10706 / KCTC 4070 / PR3) TaxID=469382 RepID=L9ULT0_HALBP|nr:integrase [Halogeometricum borinquense DSM 11551]
MLAAGADGDVPNSRREFVGSKDAFVFRTLTRRKASRSHTKNRRFLGTPVRAFAVRLHTAGLSLRETEAILRLIGVDRSFQAIFQLVHRLADSVSDPQNAS